MPEMIAIIREPRHYVKMRVCDNLSGCALVVHSYVYSIGMGALFYGNGDFFDDGRQFGERFIRQVVEVFIMFFGDKQSVTGIDWCNIQKRQAIFILINFIRRNFSSNNFAENTACFVRYYFGIFSVATHIYMI